MVARQQLRIERSYQSGVRYTKIGQAAPLLFILILVVNRAAFAEPLTVLLMPIEHPETANAKPFTKTEYPFRNLEFDNESVEQWRELNIGYHYWVCGELEKFAEEEGQTIRVRFVSWDLALQEIMALAPRFDVIQVPSTWTAYLVEEKILTSVVDEPNHADYPENLLKTCHVEGQQEMYAIPWQIDIRLLFYRPELTDDPAKLATFDGFRKCLERRKEDMKSVDPNWQPFGVSLKQDWEILHSTFTYFFGGRILKKPRDKWRVAFLSEKALEGLYELWDMSRRDLIHFDSGQSTSGKPGWHRMALGLVDGRYDAMFGGLSMRVVFDKRQEINILAAPLPQLETEKAYAFLGGSHLGVTRTAVSRGHAPLARKLIKWLTSYKSGLVMFQRTESLPAHMGALSEFFKSNRRWQDVDLEALLGFARPYPSIPEWAPVVERDIVRYEFHQVLQSIAQKQDWREVKAKLEIASGRLQEALTRREIPPPPVGQTFFTGPWLPVVLSLVIVTLVAILIWRLREVQKTLGHHFAELKHSVDEKSPLVSEALDNARVEIIGKLDKFGRFADELSENFSLVAGDLVVIQQEVKSLYASTRVSDARKLSILENLFGQLNGLDTRIDKIQALTGKSHKNLEEIRDWSTELYPKVAEIHRKVLPERRKRPLGECEFRADIGYQSGKVTLELKLCHYGKRLGKPWSNWPEEAARLFELLLLRMKMPHEPMGINLSDYLLIHQNLPTSKDPRGTAQRFFTRARAYLYNFASCKCIMTTDDQKITQDRFMLQPVRKDSPEHTFSLDIKRTASDKRTEEYSQYSPPAYQFVLPQQVFLFQSNIFNTIDALRRPNLRPDEICELLEKCPRCLPGWELLSMQELGELKNKNKDFIRYQKMVLLNEAELYTETANVCASPRGKEVIIAFGQSPEEVSREFNEWGTIRRVIAERLVL